MTSARLLRLCFCLTLIALPALALGRPSGQSGAAAPSNIGCIYLPMIGAGGQAAATITTAQSASPCDGLVAAPEPSATGSSTTTSTVAATNTATSTTTATGTATATATDTVTSTATATGTATSTLTSTTTATSTSTNTTTSTVTSTATATNTATSTSTSTATATPIQPPTDSSGSIGALSGAVEIWPEYEFQPSPEGWALQIVVVLDVSGSMSANFNGQCNNIGRVVQCAVGHAGAPAASAIAGRFLRWNLPEERRIAVAKKSVQRLIELFNLPGNSNYNASHPSTDIAIVPFAEQQRVSDIFGWSSNRSALKNAVQNAGAYNNDAYQTIGGTNGAAGLYRAAQLLKERPAFTTFNGKRYNYQRVVLFVSDGMSSQFFDPSHPDLDGGPSDMMTYPEESMCYTAEESGSERTICQTTEGVGKFNGLDRPITQMINTARDIQNDPDVNAGIYTLALSNNDATGLKNGVASFPSYYFAIPSYTTFPDGKTNIDLLSQYMQDQPITLPCDPRADFKWKSTFPPESAGNVGGFTYPVIGQASVSYLGVSYQADIRADYPGGRAKYSFTDLPPGIYSLSTYLFYRHPLDPPTLGPRRYSLIETAGESHSSIEVVVNAGVQEQAPVKLKLFGNTCGGQ